MLAIASPQCIRYTAVNGTPCRSRLAGDSITAVHQAQRGEWIACRSRLAGDSITTVHQAHRGEWIAL